MKRQRWIRTEILERLSMRVTYKFGTTTENASFSLTYTPEGMILGYAEYRSPRLQDVIRAKVPLDKEMSPEENNRVIWATLQELEKTGRNRA